MNIHLNGQPTTVDVDCSVLSLLETLGVSDAPLAVLINGDIVPKGGRDVRLLQSGDRVELIGFAEGG